VWADKHYKRTGEWPNCLSGAVRDAPGEAWNSVHEALRDGLRGLARGSSLRQLLAERRGVRNKRFPPRLAIHQIKRWAHAHLSKTGTLPTRNSGPIAGVPGETWCAVNVALVQGHRGLPGGSSLVQLLRTDRRTRRRRGSRN
jgi:hypothetical protein